MRMGLLTMAALTLLIATKVTPAAEPATQPAGLAAERAAALKKGIKNFDVELICTEDELDRCYCLILHAPWPADVAAEKIPPHVLTVQVTEDQARKIIDYLAREGFLARATEPKSDADFKLPEGPAYMMSLGPYCETLGWGLPMLRRLDGLRKVLDGDAGKSMDKLLAPLAELRQAANRHAATQPATTKPAGAIPLYHDELRSPGAPPGQAPAMQIDEITHGEHYSILEVRRNRAIHVAPLPASLFVVKAACAIAQTRGTPLFAVLRDAQGPGDTSRCTVGFASDRNVDWSTYFGTEIDPDKPHEFMTVTEYRFLLRERKPPAP